MKPEVSFKSARTGKSAEVTVSMLKTRCSGIIRKMSKSCIINGKATAPVTLVLLLIATYQVLKNRRKISFQNSTIDRLISPSGIFLRFLNKSNNAKFALYRQRLSDHLKYLLHQLFPYDVLYIRCFLVPRGIRQSDLP